jgi:hypothetical protein
MPQQSNSSFSAHHMWSAASTLSEWTRHEDISDRLFNPRNTTIGLLETLADAEGQMPRTLPEQTAPSRNMTSTIGSSASSASDKRRSRRDRRSNRSDIGDIALSTNETHLSADAPSLLSWTTSSTTPTISELDFIGLDPIQGALQLIPDGHLIEPTSIPLPTFSCRFWFLNCSYTSLSEAEWKEHNLAHFRGHVPPLSNTCPLCDMTFNIPDPNISWAANMSHLAQHFKAGDDMSAARPEYVLIRHLWSKRVICDADYQELVDTCPRRHREEPYVVLAGRDRRERRGYSMPQSRI